MHQRRCCIYIIYRIYFVRLCKSYDLQHIMSRMTEHKIAIIHTINAPARHVRSYVLAICRFCESGLVRCVLRVSCWRMRSKSYRLYVACIMHKSCPHILHSYHPFCREAKRKRHTICACAGIVSEMGLCFFVCKHCSLSLSSVLSRRCALFLHPL